MRGECTTAGRRVNSRKEGQQPFYPARRPWSPRGVWPGRGIAMLSRVVPPVALLAVAACASPQQLRIDFEAGLPPGAVATGGVAVQAELAHGGTHAVRLDPGAELWLPLRAADGFGTVSMWVYDPLDLLPDEQAKTRLHGPLWGLGNSAGERLCFGLLYAPYLDGNATYGWLSTAEGGFSSRRYARTRRAQGWHQWTFTVVNATELEVACDGQPVTGYDHPTGKFFRGANGIYLRGAIEPEQTLYVDDLEVSLQDEPLRPQRIPLPGERWGPPEGVAPVALKPELAGRHPRLFFTADEVPALRQRCATTHADYFRRLIDGANAYLGQMPPTNAAECDDDQTMQQWGWWRLSTLAFAYVCTGDQRYASKAAEWMTIFAGYRDWGSGAGVNQSMGTANLMTGFACALDWIWDQLTEEQRQRFADKLMQHVELMWWKGFADPRTEGYWKGDHQNNHRHHRLSGLLLGALAVADRYPEAPAYVGAAAGDCRGVSASFPPDGSNHEGPNYMPFGYSYVVLCFDALRRCTGEDLYATTEGLRHTALFRAHCLLPGFQSTFGFSDCGDGAYYFNHYNFRLAAEYRDGAAQGLMAAAYAAEPGSFCYFPWMILWDDPTLEPLPLERIERHRRFDDLGVAFYRSSWTAPGALAVMLKCGPYGGRKIHEGAEGWINIAHDHPDANHFMLHWAGQLWTTDDGYPRENKAGANHNLILVDGEGPAQRGGGWLQPIPGMAAMGDLDAYQADDGLFSVRGDASGFYQRQGMRTMRRWLTVVDDEAVVLVDDLASDRPREFTWLLHSAADWREVAAGHYALSQGGRTLHLRLLPDDLAAELADDVLEGRDRGTVLRAVTPAPAETARFVAVLTLDAAPAVTVETAEGTLTVGVGTRQLRYDLASGAVERRR